MNNFKNYTDQFKQREKLQPVFFHRSRIANERNRAKYILKKMAGNW